MNAPVIVFDKISKSYPVYRNISSSIKYFAFNIGKVIKALRGSRFEALHNISFEVTRGETLGVIGRNGAGKSTILGLISGVLKQSEGNIIVKGRVSPLLELGAGFHDDLTGRENIILNGVLLGLTRKDVLKKMDEIIDFSELWEFIDQPIRTYSSGMLARLGFSVVSSLDPEILLIDETLAVGDLGFQKKCIERMMGFKEKGVTIVFVSHSMDNIEMICDRVMWIDEHSVRRIGVTAEVVPDYKVFWSDWKAKKRKSFQKKDTIDSESRLNKI